MLQRLFFVALAIAALVQAFSSSARAADSTAKPYSARVAHAAANALGMKTRGLKGAPLGSECVAAIQRVLDKAGLEEIAAGTLAVAAFEDALLRSGFERVTRRR